jgi:response regulator RpfG family c-di-GMP phosphodiesterase
MPTGQRILLVDDEEIVLFALRETLRREGYEVVACSDPTQALKVLGEQSFALVMTDYQMPMVTGVELLAHARRLQPEASRVLVTASLNMDRIVEAVNVGEICRLVLKPWTREELLLAVRAAVERYEALTRRFAAAGPPAAPAATLTTRVAEPPVSPGSSPAELRERYAAGGTRDLETPLEAKNREDVLKAEFESERQRHLTRIGSLEQTVQELTEQKHQLTKQLKAAYLKVQEIAENTSESAGQTKAVAELQQLLIDQTGKLAREQ